MHVDGTEVVDPQFRPVGEHETAQVRIVRVTSAFSNVIMEELASHGENE